MPHQFAYLYMYGTAGLLDAVNDDGAYSSIDELIWPDVAAVSLDFSTDVFEAVLDLALQEVNDEDDTTGFDDKEMVARYHRGNVHQELTSEAWGVEQNNAIAQVWTYTFYEGTAEHHNPHPLFVIGVQKRYLSGPK